MTEKTQDEMSQPPQGAWFLRIEDQEVYGPISMDELRSWGEEGRIAPEHQLSVDQSEWVLAETIPELGMEWVVEATDGRRFGPFPAAALHDFLDLGLVPPESPAHNRRTGAAASIGELVSSLPSPVAPAPAHDATMSDHVDQLAGLRAQLAGLTRERDAAQAQVKRLEDALAHQQRAWKDREREDGAASDQVRARVQQLEAELGAARRQQAAVEAEKVTLSARLADHVKALDEWKSRESALSSALTRRESELTAQLERAGAELGAKEKDLVKRVHELETKLSEATAERDQVAAHRRSAEEQADQVERALRARIEEFERKAASLVEQQQRDQQERQLADQQKEAAWSVRLVQVEQAAHQAQAALAALRAERDVQVRTAEERLGAETARIADLERQLAAVRAESVRGDEQRKQRDQQREADWTARLQLLESRLADKQADLETSRREVESRTAELQQQLQETGEQHTARVLDMERLLAEARLAHDNVEERRAALERQLALAMAEWTARENRLVAERLAGEEAVRGAKAAMSALTLEKERALAEAAKEVARLTERVDALSLDVHARDEAAKRANERERELMARVDQLNAALTRSQADVDEQRRAGQSLQEQLARRESELSVRQARARTLLFEEMAQREQELAAEEKLSLTLQSAMQRRKENLKRYLSSLEVLVEGPLEQQKELFEQQQAAMARLPLLEQELEQARSAEREAQERALRQSAEAASAMEQVRKDNDLLAAREQQLSSELEEQKTAMNELKERSRKIEQALNQRIERMQEENRAISRRLGEADLQIEKLDKVRADLEETLQQKLAEFQQAREQYDRELGETRQHDAELMQRLETLQQQFDASASQLDQLELASREQEAAWRDRLTHAESERDAMAAELEDWRARSEANDEALRKALFDLETLTAHVQQLEDYRAESEGRIAAEQAGLHQEIDRLQAEWQHAHEAWKYAESQRAALDEEYKRAAGETIEIQKLLQAEQGRLREIEEKGRHTAEQSAEQIRTLQVRVEQLQKQLADEQQRQAVRTQEIEAVRKNLLEEQQRGRARDQELEKIRAALTAEEERIRQRDEEIAAGKKTLLEEQARRHVLEERLLPQEKLIQDAQERIRQLEEEVVREREALRDAQETAQLRTAEVTLQLETAQTDYRGLEARFDEVLQELEQRRLNQDDEQRQFTVRQEYLQQQLEAMQQEAEKVARQYEETLGSLDQQKIRLEDELENSRVQIEDLQHRIEQLRQENQSLSLRFEQQKKFYDEERELRRQREMELQGQRKSYQELTGTLRQKEQGFAQQRKLTEEALGRAQQKEDVLNRRLEQLQNDWRTTLTRLEQAERELMTYRRGLAHQGEMPVAGSPGAPATESIRRAVRPEAPAPVARKPLSSSRPPLPPPPVKPRGIIPRAPVKPEPEATTPAGWVQDDLLPGSPESTSADEAIPQPPASQALPPPGLAKPPVIPSPKPRRVVTPGDSSTPLTNTKPQIRLQ